MTYHNILEQEKINYEEYITILYSSYGIKTTDILPFMIMPCKIGTRLFHIENNVYSMREPSVIEYEVSAIETHRNNETMIYCEPIDNTTIFNKRRWFPIYDIGNKLFFSAQDAKDKYLAERDE